MTKLLSSSIPNTFLQASQCYYILNPVSANPTKRSNTPKQLVGFCRRVVGVCFTILWGWRLKVKFLRRNSIFRPNVNPTTFASFPLNLITSSLTHCSAALPSYLIYRTTLCWNGLTDHDSLSYSMVLSIYVQYNLPFPPSGNETSPG